MFVTWILKYSSRLMMKNGAMSLQSLELTSTHSPDSLQWLIFLLAFGLQINLMSNTSYLVMSLVSDTKLLFHSISYIKRITFFYKNL